jgi:hypothetical protein
MTPQGSVFCPPVVVGVAVIVKVVAVTVRVIP